MAVMTPDRERSLPRLLPRSALFTPAHGRAHRIAVVIAVLVGALSGVAMADEGADVARVLLAVSLVTIVARKRPNT
jgi:hypothetical protein